MDIETSINPVWAFRTGNQYVTIDQMEETTKILTVAGGSMYDLYTKKKKGVWSVGNHHFKKAFKNDPLDDTELLRRVWKILDEAKVIVAHNGRFDEGCSPLYVHIKAYVITICPLRSWTSCLSSSAVQLRYQLR